MAPRKLELRTEARLASGGEAIARAPDGRVVFVAGAAPEEQVEVELTEEQPRMLRARVVRVLAPGPARAAPRCAHFGTCGGCALQHVDPAAQRQAKADAFAETLRRLGKVELAQVELEAPWGGDPWGYRTRARLTVQDGRLGYRAAQRRAVVPVQMCPVLAPPLESRLGALAEAVRDVRGEHALELLAHTDRVLAASDRVLAHTDRTVAAALQARAPGLVELAGEVLAEDDRGALLVDAGGFAQASDQGNAALLDTVERWSSARPSFTGAVVELYAGSGNFTRVLARRAARVVAVEGARAAADRARRTLPPHVEVIAQSAEVALRGLRGKAFPAALADPPRAGMHAEVPALLAGLGVRDFLMVSCDPATFARDVARLQTHGLRLVRARLFDLYPHTAHAEVAGLLTRGGPGDDA